MSAQTVGIREKYSKLLETLVTLTPAYNIATRILMDMQGKTLTEVCAKYPELLTDKMLPVAIDLFGANVSKTIDISQNSIGYRLMQLIDSVEEYLSDPRIREGLGEYLGVKVPDPRREYVSLCFEALKGSNPAALRLWNIISTSPNPWSLEALANRAKEQGLIIENKEKLAEHLRVLRGLNVITVDASWNAKRVDKYSGYTKEFIR